MATEVSRDVVFQGVTKRYDDGTLAVEALDLTVDAGEFLVLLGPSGCGKSTTLRMLAGLEEITEGEIRIGGARVNDLPPGARGLGMVFQSYALYPHMTVAENLSFGLRMARRGERLDPAEIAARVDEAVDMLGLATELEKKPRDLSGGQRQRVAIGRALVRRPKVLLMDEPLSNLDAKLRGQMRIELRRLHERHGTTTIYVTHDQVEAMTLADRIAILDGGRLQQHATPLDAYHHPANAFVASFLGTPPMNLIEGVVEDGQFVAGDLAFALPDHLLVGDGPCTFGIRPEEVAVVESGGIPADVVGIERLGGESVYHLAVAGHSIKALWRREDIAAPNVRLTVDSAVVFAGTATDGRVISNTGNRV